jgi:hypothetical protein
MRIAVVGWCSLIWCTGSLRIKSRWRLDGPALPIEFARISRDERLTLVIHPDSPEQRTYWAISEFESLEEARQNLKRREHARPEEIHSLTVDGRRNPDHIPEPVVERVSGWLKTQENLQAAIWTGLESNWEDKRGRPFSPEDAMQYLRELEDARDRATTVYDRAREYVRNTPPQIGTPVRKLVQQKGGWEDATLSAILFEPEPGKGNSQL